MYLISICEDQPEQVQILKHYLTMFFSAQKTPYTLDVHQNAESLLQALKIGKRYDVFLMDVEMPGMNGLDCGRVIREMIEEPILIYITGYKDYAFDAFGVRAYHYLLKPIAYKRFNEIMLTVVQRLKLIQQDQNEVLHIDTKEGNFTIKYYDIYYFEKNLRKIKLVYKGGEIEFYASYQELEEKLDMARFLRCHQSYLISASKVSYYRNNEIYIAACDVSLPVSKAHIKSVKERIISEIS